jgi:hypothetical protein
MRRRLRGTAPLVQPDHLGLRIHASSRLDAIGQMHGFSRALRRHRADDLETGLRIGMQAAVALSDLPRGQRIETGRRAYSDAARRQPRDHGARICRIEGQRTDRSLDRIRLPFDYRPYPLTNADDEALSTRRLRQRQHENWLCGAYNLNRPLSSHSGGNRLGRRHDRAMHGRVLAMTGRMMFTGLNRSSQQQKQR